MLVLLSGNNFALTEKKKTVVHKLETHTNMHKQKSWMDIIKVQVMH